MVQGEDTNNKQRKKTKKENTRQIQAKQRKQQM